MKNINLVITLVFCSVINFACRAIRPDAPSTSNIPIPLPQQPISQIDIPIQVDLNPFIKQADQSVPQQYSGGDNPCEGVRYSYLFQRSPLNVSGSGQSIDLNFIGSYRISGEYCAKCAFGSCVVPKPSFSCGVGEPMRQVTIGYNSAVKIQPNYAVSTNTQLTTLNANNRCRILVVNIDVTDRLLSVIRSPLQNLGAKVDQATSQINLKPNAQKVWDKLFQELKVGDFGYLNLNPSALRLSSLNMIDETLNFSIGLNCSPVLSSSSNQSTPTPLPNLSNIQPADGFDIFLDLKTSYDSLTNFLNKELRGKAIPIRKGKKFIITNSRIYGIGNSKLVVEISFKGTRKGTLYFIGTPSYNNVRNNLIVTDLTFDIKTRDVLLHIAKWILNNKITKLLRQQAQYNLTNILNDGKMKFQNELNRNIDNNIELDGTVNYLNVQSIYPSVENLLLRTLSTGKVSVKIK